MAEARVSQDEFLCPVCLDLLKDPVAIPCGHSYCKICITDCWDQEDQKRVYSCPQCRQTFSPRPALSRNTMLAEVVEKLRKTRLSDDCEPGAGDVQCDVCTGRKYRAVKSCLMCLDSYCQTHFDRHEEFHSRKPHKVIDATGRLQEMICQKHEKILEVFCRTDQKCICVLCTMDEHKNHDTVSTTAQRTEKKEQLKETQKTLQQRIQQREKDLQQLRETVESHKRSAQTAVEDSERIFTELIRSIERSRSELIRLIRDQEKTAVSRAEERLERLEQEINDLRRRDAELEQLSHTQDHIQFLQSFQSLSAPPESTDVNEDLFSSLVSFDDLRESVHQLRDKLEDFCKEQLKKISDRVTFTNIVPRTRKDFLQYSHQLTLDLNTVNNYLHLSENNRLITATDSLQPYPDHPDRFDNVCQVLCRESVCGRCYWEIEWSGDKGVFISVSYKSISRKGCSNECFFGNNDQSWSLFCSPSSYSFRHNNIETYLPVKSISSRIGVFVDHRAGTLSFYSVSDTMSLIHTVQTTFTQPLYPGFSFGSRSESRFIFGSGTGFGSGSASGFSFGSGTGSGSESGFGSGNKSGLSFESGTGFGSRSGTGFRFGSGTESGLSFVFGTGFGSGTLLGSVTESGLSFGSRTGSGTGFGSGSESGLSFGSGTGSGSGFGSGTESGLSFGSGTGFGTISGFRFGSESGFGSGSESGLSFGSGTGFGSGTESGLSFGSGTGLTFRSRSGFTVCSGSSVKLCW
ncbi:tripartite motif-containing protein 16-like [Carassius gibelio]|uniref:tripartite motif-containing protein 16-like n=1 Tax=Carassius gibelio TaxID=101364 RepID=UPI002278E081|nr:tripartite motif-containing protein 16-like [Carassius gibelio]